MSITVTTSIKRLTAVALTASALAAPAAHALPSDVGRQPSVATDLRSPDARDAAAGRSVDLRSPDTRDAASGVSVGVDTPVPVADDVSGFDWSSAGLTAAVLGGLMVLVAAGAAVLRRGPRVAV